MQLFQIQQDYQVLFSSRYYSHLSQRYVQSALSYSGQAGTPLS